jgi:antirestriction protein ArdC
MQKKVNDNSLAYLKSWIKALENDTVFIEKALSQSWLAIEYLNKNIVENTAKKTA